MDVIEDEKWYAFIVSPHFVKDGICYVLVSHILYLCCVKEDNGSTTILTSARECLCHNDDMDLGLEMDVNVSNREHKGNFEFLQLILVSIRELEYTLHEEEEFLVFR